jgi:hypothetical protein
MIVLIPLPAAGCSRQRAHNPAKLEQHQQTRIIGLMSEQGMFTAKRKVFNADFNRGCPGEERPAHPGAYSSRA